MRKQESTRQFYKSNGDTDPIYIYIYIYLDTLIQRYFQMAWAKGGKGLRKEA